jgi:hypothetical protein
MPSPLSANEVLSVLGEFSPTEIVSVVRIKYKNREPIRKTVRMHIDELKSLILSSLEDGHQAGGDMEVYLPTAGLVLVGHHDGIYWVEPGSGAA